MLTDEARVLVVDDERLIGEMVTRWLSPVGYECATALDAAYALELMSSRDFHLILLDIKMPGKSGMDLLPEIKRQYPDTEVVMMTGVVDTNIAVQAMKLGAFDYMLKPFDLVDLTTRVCHALERRRALLQSRDHWLGLVLAPERVIQSSTSGFVDQYPAAGNGLRYQGRSTSVRELKPRALEVLTLMAQGYSNCTIAERLVLQPKTVENYINNIYRTLNPDNDGYVHPRVQAVLEYNHYTSGSYKNGNDLASR